MTADSPIPAAQYLRMSTDQQYSLENQSDAIAQYAEERGFSVVKTYTDAAKSGLRLKNRAGLKKLLKERPRTLVKAFVGHRSSNDKLEGARAVHAVPRQKREEINTSVNYQRQN